MTRVLIVDDNVYLRACLVRLIDGNADFEVVGDCSDGSEVAAALSAVRPDIVLIDGRKRTVSAVDVAVKLQGKYSTARVVMLTSDATESSEITARANGAVGYRIGPAGLLTLPVGRLVASSAAKRRGHAVQVDCREAAQHLAASPPSGHRDQQRRELLQLVRWDAGQMLGQGGG